MRTYSRLLLEILLAFGISLGVMGQAAAAGDDLVEHVIDRLEQFQGGVSGEGDDGGGDAEESEQAEETVTKTFELTLTGDVPAGEAFAVAFFAVSPDEDLLIIGFLGLCGEFEDQDEIPALLE